MALIFLARKTSFHLFSVFVTICHIFFFLKIYFEGVTNVHAVVGNSIQGL